MPKRDRADHVLDVAGDLMLRMGYRKVTIDDIAKRASIGKGTVYLHWRSKKQLFEALILRESAELTEELLDELRRDPEQVRPHRFLRSSFLATVRRPLMRALLVGNTELIGDLKQGSQRGQQLVAEDHYFRLLVSHGLLRDDIPDLPFALNAAVTGFYLLDTINPDVADLTDGAKADALARTVRAAFEPAHGPDSDTVEAVAAELIALLENVTTSFRKWVYAHDPEPDPNQH